MSTVTVRKLYSYDHIGSPPPTIADVKMIPQDEIEEYWKLQGTLNFTADSDEAAKIKEMFENGEIVIAPTVVDGKVVAYDLVQAPPQGKE